MSIKVLLIILNNVIKIWNFSFNLLIREEFKFVFGLFVGEKFVLKLEKLVDVEFL